MKHIIVFFLFVLTAAAQPVISPGGVANMASLAPTGLNNSGLAQGSIFVVNGTGLGAPNSNTFNIFQNAVYPLPTSQGLNGTTIQLVGNGASLYAIMLYESPTLLVGIIPSAMPTGYATVNANYQGQTSNAVQVLIVAQAFGIFTAAVASGLPSIGTGPAVVENVNPDGSLTGNGLGGSAQPGQTVYLYGTGMGPATGDESQGPLQVAGPVSFQIFVGNQLAEQSGPGYNANNYFGRLYGQGFSNAGVDVFEFQVPQGVQGCYVSVAAVVDGVTSNLGSMSIAPSGGLCSDNVLGYSTADFQQFINDSASRIGTVSLGTLTLSNGSASVRQDQVSAGFVNLSQTQLLSNPNVPSVGSCQVVTFTGTTQPGITNQVPLGTFMDAGPAVSISGPDGSLQETENPANLQYNANFNPPFVDPGTYTVNNGAGGSAVGPFQGTITLPNAPQWLDENTISEVGENSNLRITWSGGDPNGAIAIIGASIDTNASVGAEFTCTANTSDGQFVVPSYVLSWMPDSDYSAGFLSVNAIGQTRFQAPGLEVGYLTYVIGAGEPLNYIPQAEIF